VQYEVVMSGVQCAWQSAEITAQRESSSGLGGEKTSAAIFL